jgi:hypothetical protein
VVGRAVFSRRAVPVWSICGVWEKGLTVSNEGTPEPTRNGTRLYSLTFHADWFKNESQTSLSRGTPRLGTRKARVVGPLGQPVQDTDCFETPSEDLYGKGTCLI